MAVVIAIYSDAQVAPSPPTTTPTLDGYIDWIRTIMGVADTILPDDSPYIQMSFDMAIALVNQYLMVSPTVYTMAVYNLAGDILCNIAQDDPSLDPPDDTYWTTLRGSLGINNFIPGLINATNDEDTSAAILTPLAMQNLTLGDLQNLKTPWGRMYLSLAQSVGTMWGLTI